MYKKIVTSFVASVLTVSSVTAVATPVKALLIVQNHASEEFKRPLSNLADRLSAALSGDVFNVIDPADVIGDTQNITPSGEKMPQLSASRLAELCNAKAIITASIDEMSVESFGNPVRLQRLRATLSLQAKQVPDGAAVKGVTVSVEGEKRQVAQFKVNENMLYSQLVSKLVAAAKGQFLDEASKIVWVNNDVATVEVAFACNYPGADVSIDGVSYGTAGVVGQAPLKVKVTPGVHNLKVSYPFTVDYAVRANFVDGSTYMINLQENDEGRIRRRSDAHYAALMERITKSGATDDEVRLIKAKGYGAYLAASHTRIAGMPKVLKKWMWNSNESTPDFGLGGGALKDEKTMSTEKMLLDAAKESNNSK